LGPLSAAADGGQGLELGGHKQRELLAFLLINLNRCVTATRIADALWCGAPPAGADVTLRTHVSHLLRWLAGSPATGCSSSPTRSTPPSSSVCWNVAKRRWGSVTLSTRPECSVRR